MDIIKLISFEWFGKIYKFLDCEIRELLKTENANKVIGISNNGKELVAVDGGGGATITELTLANFWATLKLGSTAVSIGDTVTFRNIGDGSYSVSMGSFVKVSDSYATYAGSGYIQMSGRCFVCPFFAIDNTTANGIVVVYFDENNELQELNMQITNVVDMHLLHHQ